MRGPIGNIFDVGPVTIKICMFVAVLCTTCKVMLGVCCDVLSLCVLKTRVD